MRQNAYDRSNVTTLNLSLTSIKYSAAVHKHWPQQRLELVYWQL